MNRKSFLTFIGTIFILSACKKEPSSDPNGNHAIASNAVLVLNEGLFNGNNASLSCINPEDGEVSHNVFQQINGRKLGDSGNDIKKYGGKIYVVVTTSSQLEVLNAKGVSIAQIGFFDGGVSRQPRKIAFHGSNAFVCSFDGTVAVIDTATLQVNQFIQAGKNPDGIAVQNDKIYVSNSGGLDFPNYDSTLSVIDPFTFQEEQKITVGVNPGVVVADAFGDVYVVTRGDYASIPPRLKVIDANSNTIKHTFDFPAGNIAMGANRAYVSNYDFVSGSAPIVEIDTQADTVVNEALIDGSQFVTIYGIAVDKSNGDIYCSDANGFANIGEIFCFDSQGNLKTSFSAGLNPGHFVFMGQ